MPGTAQDTTNHAASQVPVRGDIWVFPMTVAPRLTDTLAALLDPAQRARADRFRTQELRARYAVRTGLLRTILARYTGTAPSAISIGSGPAGKPRVRAPASGRLSFNLSHTRDLCVLAVCQDAEIGVDIETLMHDYPWRRLAAQFFDPGEAQILEGLPLAEQVPAFFRVWTRKEAYIKALGLGMSHGLDQFKVPVTPGEPLRVITSGLDSERPGAWCLRDFERHGNIFGALALRGQGIDLRQAAWDDGTPAWSRYTTRPDDLAEATATVPMHPVPERLRTLAVDLRPAAWFKDERG